MEFLKGFQGPLTIKVDTSLLHTGRNCSKERLHRGIVTSIFYKEDFHKVILNRPLPWLMWMNR